MRPISRLLSEVYSKVVELRNDRFDQGEAETVEAGFPLLSVGNLTVGGTGKTPIVQFILNYLCQKKIKTVVISRAYKAKAKKPTKIDRENIDPRFYGDEPSMLAEANSDVDFYVGKSKSEIAKSLSGYQIGIIDDGFQHRRLKRQLDIVILDATEEIDNYRCLPLGKAREEFQGLRRADLIVISKVNLALKSDVQKLIHKIRTEVSSFIPIIEFEVKWDQLKHLDQQKVQSVTSLKDKKVFAFCAIGRPDLFERTILDFQPGEIEFFSFPDHHQFTDKDLSELLLKMKSFQPDFVVCTEKDMVKLKHCWSPEIDIWSLQMSVMPVSDAKVFYEKIDQVLRF